MKFLFLIVLFSCQSEVVELPEKSSIEEINVINSELDVAMQSMAKSLAISFKDKEVRDFVQCEALKQFDGDYNFLIKSVKDQKLNGKSFGRLLTDEVDKKSPVNARVFEEVVEVVPTVQIAVPVNIEKWDTENFVPLVAFVHSDFEENVTPYVQAFDADGNIHWLDANNDPDFPVVVINLNERVEFDKAGRMHFRFLPDELNPEISSSQRIETSSSCRVSGRSEYLHGMMTKKLSYWESWVLGKPEIRVRYFYGTEAKNGSEPVFTYNAMHSPKRGQIDNIWHYPNSRLGMWDPVRRGDAYNMSWIEEDGGSLDIEVTLGISYKLEGVTYSVNPKIKRANKDQLMLQIIIPFDDCFFQLNVGSGDAEVRFKRENK